VPSSFQIAWRFFTQSKRSMFLSAVGVVFGVAFYITGQAQTEGFQNFFIDTILGSKGAIIIQDRFQASYSSLIEERQNKLVMVANPQKRKFYPGITDANRVTRVIEEYPNVEATSPILEIKASIRAGLRSEVASLYAIDIDAHTATTDLKYQIIDGTFTGFEQDPDGLLVGKELADKLDMFVGQAVNLTGPEAQTRRFTIRGIYETGINAIDQKRIYSHLRPAKYLVDGVASTSFILVKLKDSQRAREDAKAFEQLLGHRSRPWQDREKSNMQIFRTLRISAGLAISCIILLAGFGIFNILTMSVLEKTKEIAILRSMGYTRFDIVAIFVWQGLMVAVLGILLGWIAGLFLTWTVTHIPIKIRGIFKADHFIVVYSIKHYFQAALLAMISVLIASWIPARRAARMEPVHILRGTSQ
jgi:lipoprotein-releasing system permease protein